MCTVTIIPKGDNDFILTSNRDEAPNRISLPPNFYEANNIKLLFPKDEQSGGTWIGVSEKNMLICVLNGGFEIHERKPEYRKSRGVVAKDFLIAEDIITTINDYNLENIEPFTIVIADWNSNLKFYELVWDGNQKHILELPLEPRIWSSSTLYSKAMKNERLEWFSSFKSDHELNANSLLEFHKTAGSGNDDYGVIMNRGFVKTTSITQVEKQNDAIEMRYENLRNKLVSIETFNLPQVVNE
ncbi:Transport and Golgi organisation 2 [Flaviramulus basaltis]|uniref:Transport and Golgi organisation 2 n=1 Tax=Flaviramulus basaltis TaxID=369401 RepID=A0A1K2IMX3_9FLAO|nr:NRDE family protein [Flaviramulus basaltis]SFZ93727.1 Transport and Golgi organisation 2 [Flaviramulus basaltis]